MIDLKKIIHKILVRLDNTYTKPEIDVLLLDQPKATFSIDPPLKPQGEEGDIWIQYAIKGFHYYTIDDVDTSDLVVGDYIECEFCEERKQITLPPGVYQLKCWGAQGGSIDDVEGGSGGFATGQLTLSQSTTLYLYVGGVGDVASTSGTTVDGGFNGGGAARIGDNTYPCGSGGGASDIRIGTDSLLARVIVAGGGGGAGYQSAGGAGGGLEGLQGENSGGAPGTQTAAGIANDSSNATAATFGIGGGNNNTATNGTMIAGGGGGWYGGAHHNAATTSTRGGGGGSSYVYTSSTASNYPSGCLLNSDYYLKNTTIIDGTEEFFSPNGVDIEQGRKNTGFITIIVLSLV